MDFDCIVVGAGPGGCVAARELAAAGCSVALADRCSREQLGKPIIVEAERSMFARVGVSLPSSAEVAYHPRSYRVFSDRGRLAYDCKWEHPNLPLALDHFVGKLVAVAEGAGAVLLEGYEAVGPVLGSGRVAGVRFRRGDVTEELSARLVIDASGFDAALVRKLDGELDCGFVDDSADVVVAENFLHRIHQAEAAEAVRDGRQRDEELRSRLGFAGAYSTEHAHLSLGSGSAYILVGKKRDAPGPSVRSSIDSFRRRKGYFGEPITGGGGLIRVSCSLPRLVADGFMVIGEAASQVIPIHGSGVSSALYAGWLAAGVAARALRFGEPTTAALWPYARLYQRDRGAVLAAYDIARRAFDRFSEQQVRAMLESGISQPEDVLQGALPVLPRPSWSTLPARLAGFARHRELIMPLLRMSRLSRAMHRHYQSYPSRYCRQPFEAWWQRRRRLLVSLAR